MFNFLIHLFIVLQLLTGFGIFKPTYGFLKEKTIVTKKNKQQNIFQAILKQNILPLGIGMVFLS